MNLSELINEILVEWAYRIDDGQPNPKNQKHISELSLVLSEMGLSEIKHELIQTLTEADSKQFKNPALNKEIPYKDKDTVLNQDKYTYHDLETIFRIYERPGLQTFLDILFNNYKVGIFTAGSAAYAEEIVHNLFKNSFKLSFSDSLSIMF